MIKAWSYSRYTTYKQCPLKAKLKFIDKIKEPASPAMERGSKIHDLAEEYLTGFGRRLVPKELTLFANLFRGLRKKSRKVTDRMVVEEMWCFKKDWSQTVFNDWKECWLRVKLDTAWYEGDVMVVNDWKTGKFRIDNMDDYMEQLELYALAAMLVNEDVEEVRPRLTYLDQGTTYPDDVEKAICYMRKDIPKLKKTWEKRSWPMLNDIKFAPRPNKFCGWCYFRKSEGGQCKF